MGFFKSVKIDRRMTSNLPQARERGFCRDCEHWTATPLDYSPHQGKCCNGENRRGGQSCQWFKSKILSEAQQNDVHVDA
jgi:hypothetical protein